MLDVNSEVIHLIKNNLIKFGESIYKRKGSFVVVSQISFDDDLNIVPTIQEAPLILLKWKKLKDN